MAEVLKVFPSEKDVGGAVTPSISRAASEENLVAREAAMFPFPFVESGFEGEAASGVFKIREGRAVIGGYYVTAPERNVAAPGTGFHVGFLRLSKSGTKVISAKGFKTTQNTKPVLAPKVDLLSGWFRTAAGFVSYAANAVDYNPLFTFGGKLALLKDTVQTNFRTGPLWKPLHLNAIEEFPISNGATGSGFTVLIDGTYKLFAVVWVGVGSLAGTWLLELRKGIGSGLGFPFNGTVLESDSNIIGAGGFTPVFVSSEISLSAGERVWVTMRRSSTLVGTASFEGPDAGITPTTQHFLSEFSAWRIGD